MIKVIVVDDQAQVREGLRILLETEPDIALVGEAENDEGALVLAQDAQPDIALVDVKMPRLDGLRATAALRESMPSCAVVMLTLYDDPRTREEAAAAGAAAFVGKRVAPEVLLTAIRQVKR